MKTLALVLAILACPGAARAEENDGEALRGYLARTYPSLSLVDRYRSAFPEETVGSDTLWAANTPAPTIASAADLNRALVGLEDVHVQISDPNAAGSTTLGVLFRTSADNHMIVWRTLDDTFPVRRGDAVLSINGMPTAAWLESASASMFGGSRRSRRAEAALTLGIGSRVVHRLANLGETITLVVQSGAAPSRTVSLTYVAMNEERAAALSAALDQPDLPERFRAGRTRVGAVHIGAFAPQYDSTFIQASDAAEQRPGVSEDQAMVVGFCAVVNRFVANFDRIAARSDVMVLDLRGNFGGFVREARLLALAMARATLPRTWDIVSTTTRGQVRLTEQQTDAVCGHVRSTTPLLVLTDAGTRSSGEFMATWLWAAGHPVIGERTVGAGGGREFGAAPFTLPISGLRVSASTNFSVFDPIGGLHAGEMSEAALLDQATADRFAPSRSRPFLIQSAGLASDIVTTTTLADLQDNGVGLVARAIATLRRDGRLQGARSRR